MHTMDEINSGVLTLFDGGQPACHVLPSNLVGWTKQGNALTVMLRVTGATRDIVEAVQVSVAPANAEAPAVLASWIPPGSPDQLRQAHAKATVAAPGSRQA
ncbi:hypothetical protein [Luteibacter sp. 9135]|uniref:hypothetical protein n=1 Tax=Luteibacter sp. 9135 TaxID=1500893 RepID=UPI000A57B5A3|nr:hypothetical protein [Luteibacter sp. 9135]